MNTSYSGTVDGIIRNSAKAESVSALNGKLPGAGALLLLFLVGVILQLREEWTLNPQYFYGWGVPILGILLFRGRWQDRPPAEACSAKRRLLAAAISALVFWLPLRILREANMDWRLLQWVIGLGAIGFMLGTVYWIGGSSWLRHFALPFLFLFLAVPLPTRIETLLIQSSTYVVVHGAVEALRWLGIPAWSAGNIIQLPTASLGVDEACSGLRSFQGSMMCSFFLGELARLTRTRRVWLVLIGLCVALGLNFLRTVILTVIAAQRGVNAVEFWHDSTGMVTLVAAFLVLWGTALALQKRGSMPKASRGRNEPFVVIPLRFTASCAVWLLIVEAACALWFSAHNRAAIGKSWTFNAKEATHMVAEPIPGKIKSILKYNEGECYRRSPPDGTQWWVYNIGWRPDGAGAPQARFHSPEVCLPAAGFRLVSRGPLFYPVKGNVAFRSYEFEYLTRPVYLFSSFYSSTRTGAIQSMDEFDLTWGKRVRLALDGQLPAEQKVFQVLIGGAPSEQAAKKAFTEFAEKTLRQKS